MEKSDNDNRTDNDDAGFEINDYRETIESDESFGSFDRKNDDENADDYYDEDEDGFDEEYTGPILPGGHRFDRKLLCVRYPGVVENPEKAIETLGGVGGISTAFDTPNRRLELRFRPQDGYCKPTCGDRHPTAGFLLRVRVKKSRLRQARETEKQILDSEKFKGPYDISKLEKLLGPLGKKVTLGDAEKTVESIMETDEKSTGNSVEKIADNVQEKSNVFEGITNISSINEIPTEPNIREREISYSKTSEKFSPDKVKDPSNRYVRREEDFSKDENYRVPMLKVIGRVETEFDFQNLCDFQFLPIGKNIANPKIDENIYESIYPVEIPPYRWLKSKVPYFLPPPAFSRMDSVQQYSLKAESDKGPKNLIGKTRKRRPGFSNFINFDSPETPYQPPPGIETAMRIKFLQKSHLDRMNEIFNERPIWSKSALLCVSNFTNEQLKFLLPSVAYYFTTGPWRIMWVKLGYDPRKDPQARKYQTLDYRLKALHGLESTIKCKRTTSEYTLPYKSGPGMKPRTTVLTSMQDEDESQKKDHLSNELSYIYREGVVPPSRQMFYQYCDIQVPEIQEMFAKLPNHWPGSKCHEKRGWLPSGFSEQSREIINRQVRAVLRKQMNIPEDHPTSLPRKRIHKKDLRLSRLTIEELSKKSRKKKQKEPSETRNEDLEGSAETSKRENPVPSTTP